MLAVTVVPGTKGSIDLSDVAEPPLEDGPVLVETTAIGICGTDIEIVNIIVMVMVRVIKRKNQDVQRVQVVISQMKNIGMNFLIELMKPIWEMIQV